jgi:hypothetical protein
VKHDRKAMDDYATKSARRTRTAIQRVNSHKYRELLGATGTDDARPRVVNVEPVRTGFEGHFRPAQSEAPRTPRVPHITLKDLARIADKPEPEAARSPTLWHSLMQQYREEKAARDANDPYANLDMDKIDLSPPTDDEAEGTATETEA